jgi:hypothetical protein
MFQPAYVMRCTNDTVVADRPVILFTVHAYIAVAGDVFEIWNAQDLLSGGLVTHSLGAVNSSNEIDYGPGVFLNNGLTVHIGTAGDTVTVVYLPVEDLNLP